MAREINLVPDVKNEMIKALKLRNLLLFVSIVVAAASIGITAIFATSAAIQQHAVNTKNDTIEQLSAKLKSYNDLNEFITIRDQLSSISSLTDDKKMMSRTFNILSALIPNGVDTIKISQLSVDLNEEQPTMIMTAQANAGEAPYIDYRVLDSFKKSMNYMRYDYGDYVDKQNNIIPAYCMIETNPDGSFLNDESRGLYAFWLINSEGCNPAASSEQSPTYSYEEYEGQQVVRIWRTPQFADWYRDGSEESLISLDGTISGIEHFNSACITYSGDNSANSLSPKWSESNESCWLVPGGTEGITINESSNGRDSNEELVLTFSAGITLAPEVYEFANSHMIALAPSGRHNVTDSYVQVQSMFGEKATKCAATDAACNAPVEQTTPEGGEQ